MHEPLLGWVGEWEGERWRGRQHEKKASFSIDALFPSSCSSTTILMTNVNSHAAPNASTCLAMMLTIVTASSGHQMSVCVPPIIVSLQHPRRERRRPCAVASSDSMSQFWTSIGRSFQVWEEELPIFWQLDQTVLVNLIDHLYWPCM